MEKLGLNEIRESFLKFFESKDVQALFVYMIGTKSQAIRLVYDADPVITEHQIFWILLVTV